MATVEERPRHCVIRYRDAHGYMQELRLSQAEARTIRAIRQAARRANLRWLARHTTFTDLELDPSQVAAAEKPRLSTGYCWEGPRFDFTWLIGASRVWNGEPVLEVEGQRYCTFCWDALLPDLSYCLGCDRSGMDALIPPPSPHDLALRRVQVPKRDGLNGGRS